MASNESLAAEIRFRLGGRDTLSSSGNNGNFEFVTRDSKTKVLPSTCSPRAFILSKYVRNIMSIPCAGSVIKEKINLFSVSRDFRRLITFIGKYSDPSGKRELAALIFPVFVHFKLLLLQSGENNVYDSKTFFYQHGSVFKPHKSYAEPIMRLWNFANIQEVKEDPYFSKFLNNKYKIQIAPDVFEDLRDFVSCVDNIPGQSALRFVLHFFFHFENKNIAGYIKNLTKDVIASESDDEDKSEPEDEEQLKSYLEPTQDFNGGSNDNEKDVISFSELDSVLQDMTVNHPRMSTVVAKCPDSICSVDFNDENNEMVFTTGDSHVYFTSFKMKVTEEKEPADDDDEDDTDENEQTQGEEGEEDDEEEEEEEGVEEEEEDDDEYDEDLDDEDISRSQQNKSDIEFSKSFSQDDASKITEDEDSEQLDTEESHQSVVNKVMTPNKECVSGVKYLPESPHHVLVACKTRVYLFNTETFTFELDYEGDGYAITAVDISTLCIYFATATTCNSACLYRFDDHSKIQEFLGHESVVTCLKFHPNALYLATGSNDRKIKLFEVDSGLCVRLFFFHSTWITELAFSPNGKLLASGDAQGCVKTWDIKKGSLISEVNFSKVDCDTSASVTSVCFHPDNRVLAACNRKGEFKTWDIRNPEKTNSVNFVKTPLKIKYLGKWQLALQNFGTD